jgi:hypothetical protein
VIRGTEEADSRTCPLGLQTDVKREHQAATWLIPMLHPTARPDLSHLASATVSYSTPPCCPEPCSHTQCSQFGPRFLEPAAPTTGEAHCRCRCT